MSGFGWEGGRDPHETLRSPTFPGIGYGIGTWDSADVPNVGYVARILNEYYPLIPNQPAGLANDNQRAAAVQAAIWFFSDRYVLSTSDPLYPTVVAIVDHIRTAGPLVQPPPPSLTVTPSIASGAAGRAVGPFTVTTNAPHATVTVTGGSMYSNQAGTVPIADGAQVPSGQKIWLRSTGTSTAVLEATSEATVPTGNVYLYDGNYPGTNHAQKLILAETATLRTTVDATAEFLPSGSLVVKKTITGPAAGSQARVVIHVACDDGVRRPDFIIPAGTPAGTKSKTYHLIPVGTVCTVTETSNGSVVGTDVVVTGDGQEVTIPSGASKTVDITDSYHAIVSPGPPTSGSLVVTKTIAGPRAGQQGPVTIHAVCNGTALSPDLVIATGTPASSVSHSFDGIPAGSVCTVTETADGATDTVAATVSGNRQTVTVPGGKAVPVHVTDVYEGRPGSLKVTKTIAGSAAGQHGPIAILVACGGLHNFAYLIRAHTGAGSVSRYFDGIPAGSRCTVTEVAAGRTSTVRVVTTGRRQKVTISANGLAAVHITDSFSRIATPPPPRVTG